MANGWLEGLLRPPAGSLVTITVAPSGTGRSRGIATAPPPFEEAGRLGSPLGSDPGLVRTTVSSGRQVSEHERRLAVRRHDKGSAREGNRPGSGLAHDLRHPLLPREPGFAPIELARERGGPDAEADRRAGSDCGDRRDGLDPARTKRDDIRALPCRLLQDARPQLRRRHGCLRSVGKSARGVRELGELLAAALAPREVRLVCPRVLRVEGVERVGGGQVV